MHETSTLSHQERRPMNVPLLEKIIETIVTNPDDFAMRVWHCGAEHCIGGWSQVLSGVAESEDVAAMAALLGIEFKSAFGDGILLDPACASGRLFLTQCWPEQFLIAYRDAADTTEGAQVAANRIRHFIATEGRE